MDEERNSLKHLIHEQLLKEDDGVYPDYWRGSSAGYCMRYNIFKRLHVPEVPEVVEGQSQRQGTLRIGHQVHALMQSLTKNAGLSVEQEAELKSKEWDMVGHFDDLIKFPNGELVLYDYKTVHSQALKYPPELKNTHRMQVGSYLYLLREKYPKLTKARIMEISKDDFLMREIEFDWDDTLKSDLEAYWTELNDWWAIYHETGELPPCTCSERLGAWFATRNKYGKVWNGYYFNEQPCSLAWFEQHRQLTNAEKEAMH